MQQQQTGYALAMRVTRESVAVNLLLSLGKLAAGIWGRSAAMVSDAVHSASDVFSSLIVMVGLRMSRKGEDDDHEYGHERLESVAAILLSVALAITGGLIGLSGYEGIRSAGAVPLPVPAVGALAAAAVSIAVKEGMFWYTRWAANKCGSAALMADAWHHRSDALSSVGSFIGIAGARLGWPVLDSVASVVISLFILKAALDIFRDAIDQMTDHAASPQLEREIRALVQAQEGVDRVDLLKTRRFGSRVYVDIEFSADGSLSLTDAHQIAQQVHDRVEEAFPAVKHCMIHVNPLG